MIVHAWHWTSGLFLENYVVKKPYSTYLLVLNPFAYGISDNQRFRKTFYIKKQQD